MKIKRFFSLLLATLLLTVIIAPSASASEKASYYLDSYAIAIQAGSGGKMTVTYGVYGTKTMDKIGAYSLKIEVETIADKWVSIATIYGDDHPEEMYSTDSLFHENSYTFYGAPGSRYRATLVAYAALGSGSDTGEIVSAARVCK